MRRARAAVDVVVRWGTSVLHACTLSPGVPFRIGEDPRSCDCVAPSALLGGSGITLLWWDDAMRPHLAGWPADVPLAHGDYVVRLETLVLEVSVHDAEAPARKGRSWEHAAWSAWALCLSVISHAACAVGLCMILPSPLASATMPPERSEQRVFAYRAVKLEPEEAPYDDGIGGEGELTKTGNAGEGYVSPLGRSGAWGNLGPDDNPDAHLARLGEDNWWWGGWMWRQDVVLPGSPVGPMHHELRDALGRDPASSLGKVSARSTTYPNGTGRQRAARVGGNADVVLRSGSGGATRFGDGLIPWTETPSAGRGRTHRVGAPSLHRRLPADVVRRVVGRHTGALRMCRLHAHPRAYSGLDVSFVVGREGNVEQLRVGEEGGDDELVRCVSSVFERMEFPAPPSGAVQVSVPVSFSDPGR